MPLPYILGFTYFYSKKFFVSREVVIPRPDTEILIETILKNEASDRLRFIDMGTGSGIIAETLVNERPSWKAFAADLSTSALKVAKRNCSEKVFLFCDTRDCLGIYVKRLQGPAGTTQDIGLSENTAT